MQGQTQPSSGGLQFTNVIKSFGGTRALKGVSMTVARGEIVALLGENGAGKSTLIKVLGGIYHADEGHVSIDGVPYRHHPPRAGANQPVSFIHQDLGLVEWMTVAENMALAQGYGGRMAGLFGLIDWQKTEERALRALRLIDCDIDPGMRVQSLSRTEKSLVAIARALVTDCDYLVLDEPTASLPADEVGRLFSAMARLKAANVGMIYVSHRLDEVFRIADRVVVLRDGQKVGEADIAKTTTDELISWIVGRTHLDRFRKEGGQKGRTRLKVRDLQTRNAGPLSFDAYEGELLGLVGLRGAGQEEAGRALFGATAHRGDIRLDGRQLDLSNPAAAMAAGIGLMARDRIEESLASSLSIAENTFLNPGASGRGLLSYLTCGHEEDRASSIGQSVGLRPNIPSMAIESLSGGNQQKVVVGRWLATGRKLLVAEDPTAGVDIGAKAEIYRLIAEALTRGLAVIVVSTDFEEIAHICHRALVFNRGRIIRELVGADVTTEAVIAAASASEAA
ncbi:MAG: sugar ABC transporter ATP-binding protein [Ancalomicrobiaceae bacterium]|nr:sugar ABC transporter ATP-binding protein [Ancalomicrobiaceae bacterium]